MSRRRLGANGVCINGQWYWSEALYGRRLPVCCGQPVGGCVDVYDIDTMDLICTARLVRKEMN